MSTNTFIQEQHQIFQRYHSIMKDYNSKKDKAKADLDRDKKAAQATLERAKTTIDEELEQIQLIMNTTQAALAGNPWQDKVNGGTAQTSIATMNANPDAEIANCRSTAFQAHEKIVDFLKSNPTPASVRTKMGLLSVIPAILIGFIISSFSRSNAEFWIISIIAGFVCYFIFRTMRISTLKNAYANLEHAIAAAEELSRQRLQAPQEAYQRQLAQSEARHKEALRQADLTLSRSLDELRPAFIAFNNAAQKVDFLNVAWNDAGWERWAPFEATPLSPVTRLGTLTVESQPKLPTVPALIACPGSQNILIKAAGAAKDQAATAMRSLMLRLLATQPPSKVQFTLIDPVGLGKNVDIFMQLADEEYDKKLVNSRAWTDQRQIDQRLLDLSEEIVTIGQKYLRGQFKTIEDYNKQAGEVEEPYRILVVVGFPAEFTKDTADRLVKIATNGPKCGVSTLVVMDTEGAKPYDFNLADLERESVVINWNGQRFIWQDPDFEDIHLDLDTPPQLERFNGILKGIGLGSKAASEKKVPFERVAPPEEKWWSNEEWWKDHSKRTDENGRDGISVPLGRAGATKLQALELGKRNSTAHHALVAGKTGSGKTTLLHVLITNLALTYSPDEIELYLVDFKTVGFTPYATYQLPHVRVVAIQSEREFGLSVLRKLDEELVRRKNLFSKEGVQDIAQYRGKYPGMHMPRILLLVDEFQEFFTADDDIAQNAGVYLERLVRQGRGLGIHIMLGSQSLSGTSNLPTATIGQMDVRIAMRCDERDARLILSDENPAARLLSRPGEAIYNAANGLEAGNSKFQCAMLDDEELKSLLQRIQKFTEKRGYIPPKDPIVFDGNAFADLTRNKFLKKALEDDWSTTPQPVPAWLGEPIAIKDPTSIQFRPDNENNLLIVGQQEEAALSMLITSLLSLAAQHTPETARFYIVDYSPTDPPHVNRLKELGDLLPHNVKVVNRRGLLSVITEVADVVEDRMDTDEGQKTHIYLFIYGLQRARDLRPSEDFSFSSFSNGDTAQPNPSRQFTTILREGPELNVHTLVWCDTLANLNRTLERGALREFEMRVVFQMSPEDSMNLIDSPAANKLGPYRALLFSEETGRAEKFLPYGELSTDKWSQVQAVTNAILQKSRVTK